MKSKKEEPSKKKPYQKPKLEAYGDIRTMTRAVNNAGPFDGGTGAMHKTR